MSRGILTIRDDGLYRRAVPTNLADSVTGRYGVRIADLPREVVWTRPMLRRIEAIWVARGSHGVIPVNEVLRLHRGIH